MSEIGRCRPYDTCVGDCGENGIYCCDGAWDFPCVLEERNDLTRQLAGAVEALRDIEDRTRQNRPHDGAAEAAHHIARRAIDALGGR